MTLLLSLSLYTSNRTTREEEEKNVARKVTHSPGDRPRGGGGHSHTLPIRVCAAQRGRDFEAPDLERGIHFRGVF